MADGPLVSIVIPNHNYALWVVEAVMSAAEQTHAPVEIIVVDDGSTDESVSVLQRLQHDVPFTLIADPWRGAAAAKHRGVTASHAEYVCVLDADDRLHPRYVEATLGVLEANSGAGYCYTAIRYFGDYDRCWSPGPFDGQRLFLGDSYIHTGALMRRRAYDRTKGFRIRRSAEDFDLWLAMLAKGYPGCYLDEPLYEYRKHGPATREYAKTMWLMRRIKLRHPRLLVRYAVPQLGRTGYNLVTLQPLRQRRDARGEPLAAQPEGSGHELPPEVTAR